MKISRKISAEEFYELRASVEWKNVLVSELLIALDNSMYVIGVYENDTLIAMGRMVGDKVFKCLLTDIIVRPEYQNKGYGKIVVTKLLKIAQDDMQTGQKMCIEAAPTNGNIPFYVKCGMKYNPDEQEGVYIWLKK